MWHSKYLSEDGNKQLQSSGAQDGTVEGNKVEESWKVKVVDWMLTKVFLLFEL